MDVYEELKLLGKCKKAKSWEERGARSGGVRVDVYEELTLLWK